VGCVDVAEVIRILVGLERAVEESELVVDERVERDVKGLEEGVLCRDEVGRS
jgi:hypothetical protein